MKKFLVAGLVAGGMALGLAAPAQADGFDELCEAIDMGRAYGLSYDDIWDAALAGASEAGLSRQSGAAILEVAVAERCPEHLSGLGL